MTANKTDKSVPYVAFLRAVNAGMNMQMADLRHAFEELGFQNVRTVAATGNVLFDAKNADMKILEQRLEKALSKVFGWNIVVLIRTVSEIQKLVDSAPFSKMTVSNHASPQVTFLKQAPKSLNSLHGEGYKVVGLFDRAVCYVVDLSGATTPAIMRLLDKEFGKTVTTRSWNTIQKILKAST